MRIDWETATDDVAYRFRLTGRRDESSWPVEFRRETAGRYTAFDDAPGRGEVKYELRGREGGEEWALLRQQSIVTSTALWSAADLSVYPNPGNPHFNLSLELPAAGRARVDIYDLSGRLQIRLLDTMLPAGKRELTWNGRDSEGRRLSSGLYLVRLGNPGGSVTKRLIILRQVNSGGRDLA